MLKTLSLALAFSLVTSHALAADAAPTAGSDYLLIVQESTPAFALRSDPARSAAYWGGFKAYGEAMAAAGVIRGGNVVQPPSAAKSVTAKGVASHPALVSKLQQGGYFIVHTATEAEALDWAAKCPCIASGGAVEVRAIIPQNM